MKGKDENADEKLRKHKQATGATIRIEQARRLWSTLRRGEQGL